MADKKIIVNKHFRKPSEINQSVFSNLKKINKYGPGLHEYMREGEIVICNNDKDPGLYIMTESASTENPGRVINITSGENIKLSSAYSESNKTGEELELSSADTVAQAFGKVSKQVKEALENAMPRTGEALRVVVNEETGEKVLHVQYDDYTIILNDGNKLQVNTDVISGGEGGSIIYTPGNLISINPTTHAISVTGVTPELYATKQEVAELESATTSALTATQNMIESAKTEVINYVDGKGYAVEEDVAEAIAEAQISAAENAYNSATTYVNSQGFVKGPDVDAALTESKAYTDEAVEGLRNDLDQLSSSVTENISAISEQITADEEEVAQALGELEAKIDSIDPSSIELKSTTVSSFTETFIGLDGEEHPAGVYMILEFGKPDGESTYSYSNVSELFNQGDQYLTESEYEALVDAGQVDPNVTYYTYEDEEEEPQVEPEP